MIVIKFTYKNAFDVIAPLKCGTRWLKKYTSPDSVEEIKFREFEKMKNPKDNCFLLYRDIKEHFISALYTEYLWFNHTPIEFHPISEYQCSTEELNKIKSKTIDFDKYKNIDELFKKLTTRGGQFSPNFWESFYKKNNKNNFKLIHLNNLSSLFEKEILFDKTEFNFTKEYINHPTKQDVYNMLSVEQLDILNKIIEKENYYLNEILSMNL